MRLSILLALAASPAALALSKSKLSQCAVTNGICANQTMPGPEFHCGSLGLLKDSKPITETACRAAALDDCAAFCKSTDGCVSFQYAASDGDCTLYSDTIDNQEFHYNNSSSNAYYNTHCFETIPCRVPERFRIAAANASFLDGAFLQIPLHSGIAILQRSGTASPSSYAPRSFSLSGNDFVSTTSPYNLFVLNANNQPPYYAAVSQSYGDNSGSIQCSREYSAYSGWSCYDYNDSSYRLPCIQDLGNGTYQLSLCQAQAVNATEISLLPVAV